MVYKTKITVRYAETDRMGVVYYANYLIYFEIARTEFLKYKGISYRELEEKENIYLVAAESQCKYKSPITYDDEIEVETWVSQVKNSSFSFDYIIKCKDRVVTEGKTWHVFINKQGKPVKIPQRVRQLIE